MLAAEGDTGTLVSELVPALFLLLVFKYTAKIPAAEAIDELAIATATCLCRIVGCGRRLEEVQPE